MKSMEEYINEVYEKYEETEKNHQKYKTVKVKYHSPLNKLCGVVACVALIVIVFIGVKHYETNTNENIKYVSGEKLGDGTIVYKRYIRVDGEFSKIINPLMKYSEYMAIISESKNDTCIAEKSNNDLIIKTVGYMKIEKILKGEIDELDIKYLSVRWKNIFSRVRR